MNALATCSRIVSGVILVAIILVTTTAIVYRYFLGTPIMTTEELSRVLLVLVAYCGSLAVPHLREHMAVEFVYDSLPERARRVLDAIHYIIGTGFLGLLAYSGYLLATSMGGIRLPALQFPVSYLFGTVAVACGLHALIYAAETVRFFMGERLEPETVQHKEVAS